MKNIFTVKNGFKVGFGFTLGVGVGKLVEGVIFKEIAREVRLLTSFMEEKMKPKKEEE